MSDAPWKARFRCDHCLARYRSVLQHPTLGAVCPICLRPVPVPKAKPRRRKRKAKVTVPVFASAFVAEEPGHPLGKGMPMGRTLREDGESHRQAWMRLVRSDVCAYCGGPGGTVDHIQPQSLGPRGIGGLHSWLNYTGACESCNGGKSATPLLTYLARRVGVRPVRAVASRQISAKEDHDGDIGTTAATVPAQDLIRRVA